MNKNFVVPVLALGAALAAHAQGQVPTKVGVIHVQEAILSTKDGQKAAADLQAKFAPRKSGLEKKQTDITALSEQLRKGGATLNEDAQNKLRRDIDSKNTSLKRDSEDFDADVQEEEGKIMQELGGRIMSVLEKYATENGFAVIIDVSNPQTPVLWASTSVNITADIIALYDKASAAGTTAPSAARPAAPAGAAGAPSGARPGITPTAPTRTPAPVTTPAPAGAPKKQ